MNRDGKIFGFVAHVSHFFLCIRGVDYTRIYDGEFVFTLLCLTLFTEKLVKGFVVIFSRNPAIGTAAVLGDVN